MERLHAVIGPLSTNVYLLADAASREAIAIDTATPCLPWIAGALEERGWTLKLIVNTHGHWDHMGDNAAVAAHAGAEIAIHPLDAHRLTDPHPLYAPFEIDSVGARRGARGGRRGALRGDPSAGAAHAGPHGGLGLPAVRGRRAPVQRRHAVPRRVGEGGLPGRDPEAMVASIARLATLEDRLRVLPGHGAATTIGRERPWMELVRDEGRLPL